MTITDFTINEDDTQIVQWYKKLMSQVQVIDEKLDASSEAATKKKFVTGLTDKYKDDWNVVAERLLAQMNDMDQEKLFGNYYGIVKKLNDAYKERAETWTNNQVTAIPTSETEKLSDEEKKALAKERSEVAKQIKTIIDMAVTFNEAPADEPWALPKTRRGSVGKRGPRALSSYTWTIDGVAPVGKQDSLKGISGLLGFTLQKDLTQALKDAGIDTTNPADEFTVVINGKEVYGTKRDAEEVDDEEDEEEEDAE